LLKIRAKYAHTSKEAIMDINENDDLENEEIEIEEDETEELALQQDSDYEDDDEDYGRKVRKRIGKEVSKRKVIEGERDTYRQEAEDSRKELAEIRSKQFEDDKKRLTEEIESDKKLAHQALEEGETEKYLNYQEKMTDNKVQLSRNEDVNTQRASEPNNNIAGAANDWMDDNKGWIKSDPAKFKRAQRLSNKLESEGYSVNDGELYEELDKRLNRNQEPARRQQHDMGNIPDGKKIDDSKPSARLTSEDKRLMTQYSLSPDNAEHRQAWLEGKA